MLGVRTRVCVCVCVPDMVYICHTHDIVLATRILCGWSPITCVLTCITGMVTYTYLCHCHLKEIEGHGCKNLNGNIALLLAQV